MISKTLGTRKVISLILCVVFLVATILTAPRDIYTFKALDGNPGQDVTALLSNIIVNMTDIDNGNTSDLVYDGYVIGKRKIIDNKIF